MAFGQRIISCRLVSNFRLHSTCTLSGSKNIPGIFNHIKVIYLIITDCVMIFDFDMIVQVFSENEYSAFFGCDHCV